MNRNIVLMLTLFAVVLTAVISGCSSDTGIGESHDEHEHDSGEADEESGTALALNETYDVVRKGARLVLAYDTGGNSFNGTVENTTSNTLTKVRVEVHLSNGIELGPTTPVNLTPGEKVDVTLPATNQAFDGWTPHAEVGGESS